MSLCAHFNSESTCSSEGSHGTVPLQVQCPHLAAQPALGQGSVLPIDPVRGRGGLAGRRSGAGCEKLEPTRFSSLPAIPRDLRALLTMVAVFRRAALPWNRTESPCAPPGGPASPGARGGSGGEGAPLPAPGGGDVTPPPPARRPRADPGPAPPHLPRRPRAHGAPGTASGKRRSPAQVRPPPLPSRPPPRNTPPSCPCPRGRRGAGGERLRGALPSFPPSLPLPPPPARERTKGRGPTPGERRSLCGAGASRSPAGDGERVPPARPRDREGREVRGWGALTRLPSPRTFTPLALSLSPPSAAAGALEVQAAPAIPSRRLRVPGGGGGRGASPAASQ